MTTRQGRGAAPGAGPGQARATAMDAVRRALEEMARIPYVFPEEEQVDVRSATLQALDYLANPAQVTPEVGAVLAETFARLRAGTPAEQEAARVLAEHIQFRGSPAARTAVGALHAAIQTAEGRHAAGLPVRKGRPPTPPRPTTEAQRAAREEILALAVEYLQKDRTEAETLDAIIERFDPNMEVGKARARLARVLPLAQQIVDTIALCHKPADDANP